MAEYADIPYELRIEFLLRQSPLSIVSHCNLYKEARKTCAGDNFWYNYIAGMSKHKAEKLLLQIARESQQFALPLFEALLQHYKLVSGWVTASLLFLAAMRNDELALHRFETILNTTVNRLAIVRITNKLIDLINSGYYKDEKLTNEVFQEFYDTVILFKHIQENNMTVYENVLDRIKIGALNKLPAWYGQWQTGEERGYEHFIEILVTIWAKQSDVGSILRLLEKSKDYDITIYHLYSAIAPYLPTGLYGYLESQLRIKGLDYIYLVHYLGKFEDNEHLEYFLANFDKVDLTRAADWRNVLYIDPEDYVRIIHDSPLVSKDRNRLIRRIRKLYVDTRDPEAKKWSARVIELWDS